MRKLKTLENVVLSFADEPKTERWSYSRGDLRYARWRGRSIPLTSSYRATYLNYTGKVTVPTLWDRELRTIVNNESSEIMRMFTSAFTRWTDVSYDYSPVAFQPEIDAINDFV